MPTQDQAREQIRELVADYNRRVADLTETQRRESLSEVDVVNHLIVPLFSALGWPANRFQYEKQTVGGRADIEVDVENVGKLYIEAKRLGVLKELDEARQVESGLLLPDKLPPPGMAANQTKEAQQAIRYAHGVKNGKWAILTNFERLRVFNAQREWLVLAFEKPGAYITEFETLWDLSYENVKSGSLESLSNKRHREDVDQKYLAMINHWRERLAQDILANRDKNQWALRHDGELDLELLRTVVQRFLDRLVLTRFAEDHFVIEQDTLSSYREITTTNRYTFPLQEHIRNFFRQFDEQHNSALFARDIVDDAVISDSVLGELVDNLYQARYRAMTPDIMGNTYEQYLGKTLVRDNGSVKTADNLETRKKQGSYYTPQVIVQYLVDNALGRYLYGTVNGLSDGEVVGGETRRGYDQIASLKVIDPACGSGSFLIYAYEVLAEYYRREIQVLEAEFQRQRQELKDSGHVNDLDIQLRLVPIEAAISRLKNYPRIILEQHIYGVDLDPQAAEIATVNLIMRAMADLKREGRKDDPLPLILNQNIKVGNSLVGNLHLMDGAGDAAILAELRHLRADLTQAGHTSKEYKAAQARLAELGQQVRATLNEPLAGYFTDATLVKPFHWAVEFPECFVDEQGNPLGESAGFDVVVGNPPWEIVKPDLREFYAQFDTVIENPSTTRKAVEQRIEELNALDPTLERLWEAQTARVEQAAAFYRASDDYREQGGGDTATHKLFLERAWRLLKDTGRLGYIVPSGIYTDLGTKQLREMLLNEGSIDTLISLTNGMSGGGAYFESVHRSFKIAMILAQRGVHSNKIRAMFRIEPRTVPIPSDLPSVVADPNNFVTFTSESLKQFSPDSLSIMEFQTKRDYEIVETIYDSWPSFGEVTETWNVRFAYEFHMTNDRDVFNTAKRGFSLFEGKMFHHFDAFHGNPRFWVDAKIGAQRYGEKRQNSPNDYQFPRLGLRAIARSTDERTLISTMIPPHAFCGHSMYTLIGQAVGYDIQLFVMSILNSLVLDSVSRGKIASNVSLFIIEQLPMPRLVAGNPYFDALVPRAARLTCTREEFAGLWKEVIGKKWRASDGAATPEDRQLLRNEIDALVAHLYGLTRDDFEHILGTFPLVFPDTDEGRAKKESLLATYDSFTPQIKNWPRS